MPDYPEATSSALTKHYHVRAEHIARKICTMVETELDLAGLEEQRTHLHDIPGKWFSGPF
jgi:pyruvate dehydrogenase E1 component beta subunit